MTGGTEADEQIGRITPDADPEAMALDALRRSWRLDDRTCQQLALLDAVAWGLLAVARELRRKDEDG